jgi:hypothetical protein
MKRIRRIVTMMVATLTVLTFAPIVYAGTQGSCPGDTMYVRFYENAIGDTSDGDDRLYQCGSDEYNFADGPAHTLPGVCKGAIFVEDEWNDCISSVWVNFADNTWVLCLYGGAFWNNGTGVYRISTEQVRYNLAGTGVGADGLSSWRFRNYLMSC